MSCSSSSTAVSESPRTASVTLRPANNGSAAANTESMIILPPTILAQRKFCAEFPLLQSIAFPRHIVH